MRHTLHKLGELALTNVATFAFPLVFAVVCGRTLGLHDYGIVAFYTALAAFLGVIVEFGFDWYGIREVSQNAASPAHGHKVLCNVTAARVLVCAAVLCCAGAALLALRGPAEAALMLPAAAHLVGFAFDASWYVRALERTRLLLAITVVVRVLGIAVLVGLVVAAGDMAEALWSYAFVTLATSATTWLALQRVGALRWSSIDRGYVRHLLHGAWAILVGNLSGALLTNGGVALLGAFADPTVVGAANLALRVKMAGQAVLLPVQQLGYVRIAALAKAAPQRALAVARQELTALLGIAGVVALAATWLAPWITQVVFKAPVANAVALISLLSLSIPVHAAANLFGMQSLVAFGQERAYAAILSVASVVFCALLLLLPAPTAYGWSTVIAELLVMLACGLWMRRALALRGVAA